MKKKLNIAVLIIFLFNIIYSNASTVYAIVEESNSTESMMVDTEQLELENPFNLVEGIKESTGVTEEEVTEDENIEKSEVIEQVKNKEEINSSPEILRDSIDYGSKFITNVEIFDWENNQLVSVSNNSNFNLKYSFMIDDSIDIKSGDLMTIELPSEIKTGMKTAFDLLDQDGFVIGHAVIAHGATNFIVTFTDTFENKISRVGTINIQVEMKINDSETGKDIPLVFPSGDDGSIEKVVFVRESGNGDTATPQDWDWYLYKLGEQVVWEENRLKWIVRLNGPHDELRNAVYEDNLGEGHTLDKVAGIKIQRGKWNNTGHLLTETIEDISNSTKVNYKENGFTVNLGDIGGYGYWLEYYTTIDNDLEQVKFSNNGKLTADLFDLVTATVDVNYVKGSGSGDGKDQITSISGIKTWDDDDNKAGKRPEEIQVNLQVGEKIVETKKVTADNDWKYTFDNLPKYSGKDLIKYVISEEKVEDYTSTVTGTNITNTYTPKIPEKTSVTVTKKWEDNNNQDRNRAKNIKITLYAVVGKSAVSKVDEVTIGEAENWTYTWTDLDVTSDGKEIEYKIKENIVVNYHNTKVEYSGTGPYNIVMTNTYVPETTEISGTKTWDDDNNKAGKRPKEIQVSLKVGDKTVETKKVTADDDWKYKFTNLPKYYNGEEIEYVISEEKVEDYTSTVTGTNITNTYTPKVPEKTSVTLTKKWEDNDNQDGKRPKSIKVQLYAVVDGEETAVGSEVIITEKNNWTYTWTDLDMTLNGDIIQYAPNEKTVDGYDKPTFDFTDPYNIIMTNSREPETTEVSGTKTWDDNNNQAKQRPDEIYVNLLSDGNLVETKKVTSDSNWKYSFVALPKYSEGKLIQYTVTEKSIDGYTPEVDGYNITNKYTPETIEISGIKAWRDDNDKAGNRPEEIKLHLYVGDQRIETKTITKQNGWKYAFTNLPKYDGQKEIEYDVKEEGVDDYTSKIEGTYIINTYTPEKTSITVVKKWEDNNNQDGERPKSIEVQLYAGEKKSGKAVSLSNDNNWTYTWSDLDKRASRKEIAYTVKEVEVEGYKTSIVKNAENITITNTYEPETTKVSGTKTWDDNNNQDGKRPEEIQVNLIVDKETIDSKTVTEDDDWKYTFDNLPKYSDGNEIKYSISEEKVEDYTTTVTGTNITNTYTPKVPEKTSVTLTKKWEDNDNQDGKRPKSIKVQLYAVVDGEETAVGSEVIITEKNNWTYTWTDLEMTLNGDTIQYAPNEKTVDGYDKPTFDFTDPYNIIMTNSREPETTKVSGTKKWDDNDNQDGKRPEEIQVNLIVDNETIDNKIVTEKDDWKYTFDNLPKYSKGELIEYSISENKVEDYTSKIEGTNITNSYTPGKTSISVVKTWNDNDDQDGKRPESIEVQLYAGKEEVGEPVELSDENSWSYKWTDLDKKSAGEDITYSVKEFEVEGYQTTIVVKDSENITITNSHEPETTEITGTKTWDDNDNQDGKRPEEIQVNLIVDKETIDSKTVTEEDDWKYTFDNLPKYSNGKEIEYSISEDEVKYYTSEIKGTNITNSYTPGKTNISVVKIWDDNNDQDGKRPEAIEVQLYAVVEGTETKTAVGEKVTISKIDNWAYMWTDLDKKNAGKNITYSVEEVEVEGYETNIVVKNLENITITNSYEPETTEISGTKTWDDNDNQDGKRPVKIQVNLIVDNETIDSKTVTEEDDWKYTFDNLPKYSNGELINYSIGEDEVEYYTTIIKGENIINTYNPGVKEISGIKTWDDNNNQDGKRPEEITVNLHANGVKVASNSVTADDNWEYKFTNLPEYSSGKLIIYTITEEGIEDYTTSYNGTNITNKYTPGETSITALKAWDDGNNQDGKRPNQVVVQLYANDKKYGETIILSEANKWTHTWQGLAEKSEGKTISYTLKEENVSDYVSTIDTISKGNIVITNTYLPEQVTISGNKTWNDKNNQDKKRPDEIKINLLANGTIYQSKEVSEADNWSYDFTGLPKYSEGKLIIYTITEDNIPDYTTEISGFNIINSYTPGETSLTVTKSWDDADNQDGKRPENVTVQLYADGIELGSAITLSESNNWNYTWTGLAENSEGNQISYSVGEQKVTGYETVIDDNDKGNVLIKNSYQPEITEIVGTKIWDDNNNESGERPSSIIINLLADGQKVDSKTVTERDNWVYEFSQLPKYNEGKLINYTLTENNINDYSTQINVNNVTNSYTPNKTSFTITKKWNDNNNQDGKRLDKVEIQLYGDGKALGEKVILSQMNNWTFTWKDLDMEKAGNLIKYTVEEESTSDYETTIDYSDKGNAIIINSYKPENISLSGTKTWNDKDNQDGKRPKQVTINLLADGEVVDYKLLKESTNWSYEFTNLPKYSDGKQIKYTITEDTVEDYSTTIEGNNIINTYTPGETSVTVTKQWKDNNNQDGKRPNQIEVQLYANGEKDGEKIVLSESENWTYTWNNLAQKANGMDINYTVEETKVPNYETEVNNNNPGNIIITNSYNPETTNISGIKTWDDNNNEAGNRPTEIIVNILASGEIIDSKTVTELDEWKYEFNNLPKYTDGKLIEYTVTENNVNDYITTIDGYNITNSYVPGKTSLTITKAWEDNDNQDGKRPNKIEVQLYANDEKFGELITLSETNKWTYTWAELVEKINDQAINYTVVENEVAEYESHIHYLDSANVSLTNTYIPETVQLSGTKNGMIIIIKIINVRIKL